MMAIYLLAERQLASQGEHDSLELITYQTYKEEFTAENSLFYILFIRFPYVIRTDHMCVCGGGRNMFLYPEMARLFFFNKVHIIIMPFEVTSKYVSFIPYYPQYYITKMRTSEPRAVPTVRKSKE